MTLLSKTSINLIFFNEFHNEQFICYDERPNTRLGED